MKKTILTLLLSLLLIAPTAHAANIGTCVAADLTADEATSGWGYELLITCEADTNGALAVTLDSLTMNKLSGKFCFLITSYGNTVKDLSELEIRDSIQRVIIDNAVNGKNFITRSVIPTYTYPEGPNKDHYWVFNAKYPITIYVENNDVSKGVVNLLFTLLN
ncbi:MAG: hypothetical protein M0R74_17920 [Dehalococcoidia bacterium]|jgi:hypothetical protein|nr:hypothetical protein [Dehalococcoidia bacterium]